MDQLTDRKAERVALRKASQDGNLFGRLQAATMASRGQAQRLLQAAAGLSITEWRILWDLAEAGPLSLQDMASIQRTDHSLISRALPSMRDKGYVRTLRNSRDKRQSLVELTDAGRRAYEAAAPTMKRRREVLGAAFAPGEMKIFLAFLDRFDAYLETPIEEFSPLKESR